MHEGVSTLEVLLQNYDRSMAYSFPDQKPDYIPVSITGWAPANEKMVFAARDIFSRLETVLDIDFEETQIFSGLNVISVSQSIQTNTAGYSYYPNIYYEIGSDIFISKSYSNPSLIENDLTNYDYEVLLHEIGHALGLKHPFESDRSNLITLPLYEDNTRLTAMSYNESFSTFSGSFRDLDWMVLTKFYGVNPSFRSENNTYEFDSSSGVFIIDGGGIDTILADLTYTDIYVDLRAGAHSYKGYKSNYISVANQLTISEGSEIENVKTGFGDDLVIGNDLANIIITSSGDDLIFPDLGADIINAGLGSNFIDLSEDKHSIDKLIIENTNSMHDINTIYGFFQGLGGDVLEISGLSSSDLILLPLIDLSNIPKGLIDNSVVRITGDNLDNVEIFSEAFNDGGFLANLKINEGRNALIVSSNSQDIGEEQNIFKVSHDSGSITVTHLLSFIGNYLDIDLWSIDNFYDPDGTILA